MSTWKRRQSRFACASASWTRPPVNALPGSSRSIAARWSIASVLAISSSSCYRCCMKISVLLLLGLFANLGAAEPTAAPDAPALTHLLREFLDGASRNDVATHERFWADELIYTRAIGQRLSKADILKEIKTEAASTPKPTETERSTFS